MKRLTPIAIVTVAATVVIVGGGLLLRSRPSQAAAGPKVEQPKVEHSPVGAIYNVGHNLYVIPGGGGNTAVFVTANGVVLVDTKYDDRYQAMIDQVRTVTDKPITYAINTHCHRDHIAGNELLPASAEIVVQERTAANLERMRRERGGSTPQARRVRTFRDRLTLFSGEDAVDLYYFGPAHTDGDAFVVFRSAGVMHAGDVFPGKVAPIINTPWGGNGLTYGETIGKVTGEITGVDRVISGHGEVFDWNDLVDYGEFNRLLLGHARAAMRSGRTAHQAHMTLTLPAKFQDYHLDRLGNTFDEIYRSLTPWWRSLVPPFLSRHL